MLHLDLPAGIVRKVRGVLLSVGDVERSKPGPVVGVAARHYCPAVTWVNSYRDRNHNSRLPH